MCLTTGTDASTVETRFEVVQTKMAEDPMGPSCKLIN